MSKLWYQKSAKVWEEALPLGNGKLEKDLVYQGGHLHVRILGGKKRTLNSKIGIS